MQIRVVCGTNANCIVLTSGEGKTVACVLCEQDVLLLFQERQEA